MRVPSRDTAAADEQHVYHEHRGRSSQASPIEHGSEVSAAAPFRSAANDRLIRRTPSVVTAARAVDEAASLVPNVNTRSAA